MKNPLKKIKIFFILFLFCFFVSESIAQSKTATTIGQFLKIGPSARASALGNASTSLDGEASASYYNPAALSKLSSMQIQFTHNQWLADIDYNYAIVAVPIEGVGTLSLQVTSLNSGEIDVRTVSAPLGTGERYNVTNFALGMGYGLMLTDRVSVGLIINYLQETIWNSSLSTFSISAGVQYTVPEIEFTLGASISNFGPRTGYDGRDLYINYDFDDDIHGNNDQLPAELRTDQYGLPTLFRVGISYPLKFSESNKVMIAVDALHPNDNDESINAGLEWILMNRFALRGGYRDFLLTDSEGGLVLGAGVNVDIINSYKIMFDYAWADYGRLQQAHRFTIGLQL